MTGSNDSSFKLFMILGFSLYCMYIYLYISVGIFIFIKFQDLQPVLIISTYIPRYILELF